MKPSPPPAPDYQALAQQQGQSNIDAAKIQGKINSPNVVTPYGTQTVQYGSGFDQAGYDKAAKEWGYAQSRHAGRYGVPIPTTAYKPGYQPPTRDMFTSGDPDQATVTQALNPAQQGLLDQSVRTQGLLGGLGEQGARSLQGVVGTPVNFSGSPSAGNPQQSYANAVNAMMQRPTADYNRAVDQNKSDMAAAGIPVGSQAYNTQQELLGRQLTDAQTQAGLAGINAGNTFFNQQQQARQSANMENLTKRQTPLNEITALLSGSQASNPFTAPGYAQNSQVQPAPMYAAGNAAGQYGTDIYNANMAQQGNLQSGLFGLGSAGLMALGMSDRRLKSNIVRIGTHPLGIGLYEYDLQGRRQRGVMADELLAVKPEAVYQRSDGYLMVDYGQLR